MQSEPQLHAPPKPDSPKSKTKAHSPKDNVKSKSKAHSPPRPKRNAYVLVHFGSNIKFFELEIYFCIMLGRYANMDFDIVYLYSETDTPPEFVREIKPFVNKTIGFNDDGITFNVPDFQSAYTSFNTLRTCNFIFAYNLTQYAKICIVESDLVIMRSIDSVFNLRAPSILTYRGDPRDYNRPRLVRSSKEQSLNECETKSTLNGGVMLIEPSKAKFEECLAALPIIVEKKCKYPNEALFEYVNPNFNHLPVEYNLSHYHTLRLGKYGIRATQDVRVFHFNETEFKHLDIVKDVWFENNIENPEHEDPKLIEKYRVKRIPIEHFKYKYYLPNRDKVNSILLTLDNQKMEQRGGTRANKNKKRLSGTRRLAARKR
jgi:lipopolysaccharide biosynthesis glycosyltransferase